MGACAAVATVATVARETPAQAAPGDGVLTVEVDRDFSGDGVYDPLDDPPQPGISVTVTDGTTTQELVTDGDGHAQFDLGSFGGGRFRVDVAIDDPALDHLQAAPAAPATTPNAFRSFTSFVDGSTQTIHVGVWNPDDYVPLDPPLAVIEQHDRAGALDSRSIAVTTWDNRGPTDMSAGSNTAGFTTIATQAETGTVFGSAWDHRTDFLYSAAYAKAHTLYGPGGSGAIYRTDSTVSAPPGSTVVWATVPDAGASLHQTTTGHDDAFYLAAGREGLGGLALSGDGATLYAVNLNDRSLYSFDTADAAPAPVAGVVPIGDPGCAPSGEWRPFAVAVRDGDVYVGGVCDASYSLDRADLTAHVLRLDGTTFTPVFSHVLDFVRGANNYSDPVGNQTGPDVSTHWNPWRNTWDPDVAEYHTRAPIYPTPILSSIEFENDGSLILGFRDRTPDALVANGYAPEPGNPDPGPVVGLIVGGDINKVCLAAGVYDWEGTGACPDNHTTANSGGEPADRVEFFPGDFLDSETRYGPGTSVQHYENSMGGTAFSPREVDVANTTMDPTGLYNTGGIGFYDRRTGAGPGNSPLERGLVVAGNEFFNFGKGNGLGDISLLAAQAPSQIGNLVWFDADGDGEQDAAADEPAIPGVTVNLLSADGSTVLATTVTDANGEYYFGGEGGFPLEPGADYVVEFDIRTIDPSTLPSSPSLDELFYTLVQEPSAGPIHDSNPTALAGTPGVARAPVVAPDVGGVDHTVDAGITVAFTGAIQVVKYDGNVPDPDVGSGPDAWVTPGKPVPGDADTSATAIEYEPATAEPVRWVVTNTGETWLTDVTVSDTTDAGPDVDAWTCDLTEFGGPAAYDFADPWVGPLPPGASFFCAGQLTLPEDTSHADTVDVEAIVVVPVLDDGQLVDLDDDGYPDYATDDGAPIRSDVVVGDDDPFHAVTPEPPPASSTLPPTTTAPSTASTVPPTTTAPATTATTAPPTTAASTTSSTSTPPAVTAAPPGAPSVPAPTMPPSPSLPTTGANTSTLVVGAALIVLAGAALLASTRRRRSAT